MLGGDVSTTNAGTGGMLVPRDQGKRAAYDVVVCLATRLGAGDPQPPAVTAGALAYLVVSTLRIGALFLVAGLLTPEGEEEDDDAFTLEPYEPVGGDGRGDELYADEDESRVVTPAPVAMLGEIGRAS